MVSTDSCAETSNASKDPSKATKILIMHLPSQKWDKWNETKILFSEIAGKFSSSQRQKCMAGGSCRCLFSMTTKRTQRDTLAVSWYGTTQTVGGSVGGNVPLRRRSQLPPCSQITETRTQTMAEASVSKLLTCSAKTLHTSCTSVMELPSPESWIYIYSRRAGQKNP